MLQRAITLLLVAMAAIALLPESLPTRTPILPVSAASQDTEPAGYWTVWVPRLSAVASDTGTPGNPFGRAALASSRRTTAETSAPSPLEGHRLQGAIQGRVATILTPGGKRLMVTLGGRIGDAVLEEISTQSARFRWNGRTVILERGK